MTIDAKLRKSLAPSSTDISATFSNEKPNTMEIYLPWDPHQDGMLIILLAVSIVFILFLLVFVYWKLDALERHVCTTIALESEKGRAYNNANLDAEEGNAVESVPSRRMTAIGTSRG
eukprot:TRINITY_DN65402_c0_g1_i1.p1 TRINITY_DN65402_c0_g1~~TRINITY_DN65402_c0_g1_i1.p1  ORF type:complete len:117 (-),score=18.49 TRINITY_DN65402_c0_g1_i1:27-377(-)